MLEIIFPPYGEYPSLEIVVKTENCRYLKPFENERIVSTVNISYLNDGKIRVVVIFFTRDGLSSHAQEFEERVKNWPKLVNKLFMVSGVDAADRKDFVEELNLFLKDNTTKDLHSYLNFSQL